MSVLIPSHALENRLKFHACKIENHTGSTQSTPPVYFE